MTTNYTDFVKLAQKLIQNNGRSVTLKKLESVAVDPDKPWKGTGEITVKETATVSAVFVSASASSLGRDLVKEDLLSTVDQVALIAPTTKDLEGFHSLLDDGIVYSIKWVQVLKPGPLAVLYVFGVSR